MPGSQFSIRVASAADIETLVALRAQLIDRASEASYASRNADESLRWKIAYNEWLGQVLGVADHVRVLVAVNADGLIGCATGIVDCRPPAPDCLSGGCGWIQSVVVLRQWRRHGIAIGLMRDLLDWFTSRDVSKVVLEATSEAEILYQKLGFVRSPESLFVRDGGRP
ncbi:MAG: putative acetyltransferase [Proteobacteria bacterium]|nr:putative acetyltransferase [Pseudomonadota bacterium]